MSFYNIKNNFYLTQERFLCRFVYSLFCTKLKRDKKISIKQIEFWIFTLEYELSLVQLHKIIYVTPIMFSSYWSSLLFFWFLIGKVYFRREKTYVTLQKMVIFCFFL